MPKTNPWETILRSKFSALPLAQGFTADKLAESALADIGVDALDSAVDDSDVGALFQSWLVKYPHIKLDINPIDGVMVDAMCTGPSPLATRGDAVKRFGEASVVAALKTRGYTLTGLKPMLPVAKSDDGKKKVADDNGRTNPWSPKMAFANDADGSKRLAAKISFIAAAGPKAAASMAASAGVTLGGQPLRK